MFSSIVKRLIPFLIAFLIGLGILSFLDVESADKLTSTKTSEFRIDSSKYVMYEERRANCIPVDAHAAEHTKREKSIEDMQVRLNKLVELKTKSEKDSLERQIEILKLQLMLSTLKEKAKLGAEYPLYTEFCEDF